MEQEQLLATCEILRVTLRDDITKIMSMMLLPISEYSPLPNVGRQIAAEPKPFFISKKLSYIEQIILEKLDQPGINVFDFLISSMELATSKKFQIINSDPDIAAIMTEILTISRNYLVLSITSPEFFEGKNLVPRFSNLFQNTAPGNPAVDNLRLGLQLMARLRNNELRDELMNFFRSEIQFVVKVMTFLKNEMDKLVVFNQQVFDYLEFFTHLIGNQMFKEVIIHNMVNHDSKMGFQVEISTFLGMFFQKSILSRIQDPLMPEFIKTVIDRVKSCKTQSTYNKTCQVY